MDEEARMPRAYGITIILPARVVLDTEEGKYGPGD